MGATTRREPVRNTIPKAKAYQYYNMLDFKGIEISDNPFNTTTGSCSDCLNVYVDKEGSLTTRPRLEIMSELKNIVALQNATFIGVYGLVEGYLIHCTINNVNKFYRYANNTLTAITDSDNLCPATRCKTFEQNDVIYILTGNNYLNIISNDLSEVEGYIPLISGSTSKIIENQRITEDIKIEDYNILTTKYRKGYFWSEHSNMSLNVSENEIIDATKVFNTSMLSRFKKLYAYYNDDTFIAVDGRIAYYCKYYRTTKTYDILDSVIYDRIYNNKDIVVAKNNKKLLLLEDGDTELSFYVIENNAFVKKYNTNLDFVYYANISPNGSYIYRWGAGTNETLMYKLDTNNITAITTIPSGYINKPYFSGDDSLVVIDKSGNYYANTDITTNNWEILYSYNVQGVDINYDGSIVALYSNVQTHAIYYYYDKDFNTDKTKYYNISISNISFTNNGFFTNTYYIDNNNNYVYKLNINTADLLYTDDNENFLVFPDKFLESNYENMYVTLELLVNEETYQKLLERRQIFLNSLITSRFYNQRWFTSGSHIFYTNNNDPTYIPLYNYDLLGDDGYEVTGLNVISDTGMVAYTSKQLSIITPVKDRGDGNWDYSFTETKNTTGNVAKGNTIVTSYSTLPLQIDYKGIFTIQQTENVVSEANVVTPITNAIMRKWMKESETSRSMVENTRTMNYLYWTYFLLDTGTNTKIYVLDNRTFSWFYWEIPIRVMDMYVEDEEAVFFDYNGVKYVMKTEDINEHNNNEYNLRTYYDELPETNELIHWHWYSQILPLGSINFSKQLVATTFILNDDENTDNYGLRYRFRGFRKTIYETDNRDIEGDLQYVRNKTVRSMFTRIQFLQILLSDKTDDLIGDYSRLRLVGLGFKYRLLEANRT